MARRRRPIVGMRALVVLIVAGAPTMATIVLEWSGVPIGNLLRAFAALPLGFTIAAAVIGMAAHGREKAIG